MKGVIEAADLPHDEKVYLKKDMFGWRVVEPPKNWFRWIMGSNRNIAELLIFMVVMGLIFFGVTELIGSYQYIVANPCEFCTEYLNPFP